MWITVAALSIINAALVWVAVSLARENKALRTYALYDPLTGLVSRRLFMDRLSSKIESAKRGNESISVLFMDLDGFKSVNDTLGHKAGDVALKIVAERLNKCTRASDTVSRFGGDEFAIILPGAKTLKESCEVSSRIIESISEAMIINGQLASIGASVGIYFRNSSDQSPEQIMDEADKAMYTSKAKGKNQYSVSRLSIDINADIDLELKSN